ncbi:MAG TPA: hypothetical protein VHZ55_19275 [Bryobacteraceae bacterium]|nr:hypothetical protein [Bryobacteraceae bacterium]
MLILRTVQWGPQHGYGIGQAIRQSSAETEQSKWKLLVSAITRVMRPAQGD